MNTIDKYRASIKKPSRLNRRYRGWQLSIEALRIMGMSDRMTYSIMLNVDRGRMTWFWWRMEEIQATAKELIDTHMYGRMCAYYDEMPFKKQLLTEKKRDGKCNW